MAEKRVLIVSPPDSYRIVPYIQAAKALGLEVHLASHGEWAMTSPDARGIDIPFENPGKAIDVLRDYAADKCFVAVIGTDDSTLVLAARLAALLKLKQNSPDAVNLARRKDLSRQRLAEAGLQIPDFEVVDAKQCEDKWEPGCGFPCVVKPLALAGSRGVIRADSVDELAIVGVVLKFLLNHFGSKRAEFFNQVVARSDMSRRIWDPVAKIQLLFNVDIGRIGAEIRHLNNSFRL